MKVIKECMNDPDPGDPTTAAGYFDRFMVRRVDLTPRGDLGLAVQGFGACMCGAVGNCPFWIVAEGPDPRVLLEANGIQTFGFSKSSASGYFELVLGTHDSALVTDLQRFEFDGTKYRLNGCATIAWADDVGNELRHPVITPGPCS